MKLETGPGLKTGIEIAEHEALLNIPDQPTRAYQTEYSRGLGMEPLLSTRRFLPPFVTPFLAVFNHNLFKNAMVTLVTHGATAETSTRAAPLVTVACGLFILSFSLLWPLLC